MKNAGVLDKTVMIFGQMNEPPGARFRVGHAALTMAEYFRDDARQDVLLLIDNIFRFIQAGTEVSGLMGLLPSRLGYQPTLATEIAELEERICSTGSGAITSVQAVYVPADDFTDPAPRIPSPISPPRSCCHANAPVKVFIRRLIHSSPAPKCWLPHRRPTALQVAQEYGGTWRFTKTSKISSPCWVWKNSPRKIGGWSFRLDGWSVF